MLFMNESEIDEAAFRYARHPVLGQATRFLVLFRNEVNSHSDGWCYWSPPIRAAKQLQELIQRGGDPTEKEFEKTLRPIKAFYTRRGRAAGMRWPMEEVR